MDWMLMPLRRYAEFSGRSRRKEYWMFQLLNILVMIVPLLLIFSSVPWSTLGDPAGTVDTAPGALFWIGVVLACLWGLFVLIPGIAVTVRRLHDRDMSGWWYLGLIVLSAIPLVGWIASIALLVLLVLPGTSGANRFGADPLDPHQVEVFA
jgi:uncharacterized membrane protein YhaH (DUF805 family)